MKLNLKILMLLCFLPFFSKAQQLTTKKPDTVVKMLYTSYYAKKFEGRKTASGERYRGKKLTAAHRTLPFGTIVKVKNLVNGKIIHVRINDRGPFSKKFSLDLSQAAAKAIGIFKLGYARVEVSYVLR